MESANGFTCAICRDSICCNSTKYKSINLTCGHAFGKSCMRKWVESSNQKECCLCKNQLTDNEINKINEINEINEIKNIPLQERVVIISEKTIKLLGRTIFKLVPLLAAGTAITFGAGVAVGNATGAIGAAAGTAALVAGLAAGIAVGAVGAATGVDRDAVMAVGATAGTVGAAGAAIGAAVGVAGALGVVDRTATAVAVGFTVGTAGGTITGVIGANDAYDEQEMNLNPEVE